MVNFYLGQKQAETYVSIWQKSIHFNDYRIYGNVTENSSGV